VAALFIAAFKVRLLAVSQAMRIAATAANKQIDIGSYQCGQQTH